MEAQESSQQIQENNDTDNNTSNSQYDITEITEEQYLYYYNQYSKLKSKENVEKSQNELQDTQSALAHLNNYLSQYVAEQIQENEEKIAESSVKQNNSEIAVAEDSANYTEGDVEAFLCKDAASSSQESDEAKTTSNALHYTSTDIEAFIAKTREDSSKNYTEEELSYIRKFLYENIEASAQSQKIQKTEPEGQQPAYILEGFDDFNENIKYRRLNYDGYDPVTFELADYNPYEYYSERGPFFRRIPKEPPEEPEQLTARQRKRHGALNSWCIGEKVKRSKKNTEQVKKKPTQVPRNIPVLLNRMLVPGPKPIFIPTDNIDASLRIEKELYKNKFVPSSVQPMANPETLRCNAYAYYPHLDYLEKNNLDEDYYTRQEVIWRTDLLDYYYYQQYYQQYEAYISQYSSMNDTNFLDPNIPVLEPWKAAASSLLNPWVPVIKPLKNKGKNKYLENLKKYRKEHPNPVVSKEIKNLLESILNETDEHPWRKIILPEVEEIFSDSENSDILESETDKINYFQSEDNLMENRQRSIVNTEINIEVSNTSDKNLEQILQKTGGDENLEIYKKNFEEKGTPSVKNSEVQNTSNLDVSLENVQIPEQNTEKASIDATIMLKANEDVNTTSNVKMETNGEPAQHGRKPYWKFADGGVRKKRKQTPMERNQRFKKMVQPKNAVMCLNELVKVEFITEQEGSTANLPFVVTVEVNGQKYRGYGSSKQMAKQAAAEAALISFVQSPPAATEKDEGMMALEGADAEANNVDEKDLTPWTTLASFAMFKLFSEWKEGRIGMCPPGFSSGEIVNPNVGAAMGQGFTPSQAEAAFSPGIAIKPNKPVIPGVASAGGQAPAKALPANAAQMNPVMLLNQMRPDCVYEQNEIMDPMTPGKKKFQISCSIDGNYVVGEAPGLKKAKQNAAKQVIQLLYGVASEFPQ